MYPYCNTQLATQILECFKLVCISNKEFDAVVQWADGEMGEGGEGDGPQEDDDEEESGLLWKSRRGLVCYFKEEFRASVDFFVKKTRVRLLSENGLSM